MVTLWAAGALLSAQQPVFRSGIDLIQLDVSVLDKDHQPVRGLTAADFTVLEDGRPQPIVAFSPVDLPDAVIREPAWTKGVAPDVATNAVGDKRLFLLVLDDANLRCDVGPAVNGALLQCTRSLQDTARQIVRKLGPGDLAAVVFTSDNRHAQNWTTDRAKLMAAIDAFAPGFNGMSDRRPPVATPSRLAMADTTQLYQMQLLHTLASAVALLSDVSDRQKVLVYVGTGIRFDTQDLSKLNMGADVQDNIAATQAYEGAVDLLQAAQTAHVTIYTFDAFGLRVDAGTNVDFLMTLSNNTGGHATVNTNDFAPGVTRMFTENSSYYLIGYQSSRGNSDGSIRHVSVTVNRKDVDVLAPKWHFTPSAKGVAEAQTVAPIDGALASVVPKRDLALTVGTLPVAPAPGVRKAPVGVVVGIESPRGGPRDETTDVTIVAFDAEGRKQQAIDQEKASVAVPGTTSGPVRYEIASRLDLAPGRYIVRVAAHAMPSDKSGSVDADLVVPDFAKLPLSMTTIALHAEPHVTSAPPDALTTLVGLTPTVKREFARTDRVSARVQIYERGAKTIAPVSVTAHVVDFTNTTVSSDSSTLGADQFDAARSASFSLDVPLAGLAPGEYLLTIAASTDAKSWQTRAVPFRIR